MSKYIDLDMIRAEKDEDERGYLQYQYGRCLFILEEEIGPMIDAAYVSQKPGPDWNVKRLHENIIAYIRTIDSSWKIIAFLQIVDAGVNECEYLDYYTPDYPLTEGCNEYQDNIRTCIYFLRKYFYSRGICEAYEWEEFDNCMSYCSNITDSNSLETLFTMMRSIPIIRQAFEDRS